MTDQAAIVAARHLSAGPSSPAAADLAASKAYSFLQVAYNRGYSDSVARRAAKAQQDLLDALNKVSELAKRTVDKYRWLETTEDPELEAPASAAGILFGRTLDVLPGLRHLEKDIASPSQGGRAQKSCYEQVGWLTESIQALSKAFQGDLSILKSFPESRYYRTGSYLSETPMDYSYSRTAAEEDNTFGAGHVPLPPSLSHLGRFVANLAPAKLISHKVFMKEQVHMLTCKVNTQLSCMAQDLKYLLKLGLVRVQCNDPGTISFYFSGYSTTPVSSIDPEIYIKQAEKLGQEAFKAGLSHAPRLDVAFVRLHDAALDKMPPAVEGSPATMSVRIRFSTKLAEAWIKGWELANLAEP